MIKSSSPRELMKACSLCKERKPLSEFSDDFNLSSLSSVKSYGNICRQCRLKQRDAKAAENKEQAPMALGPKKPVDSRQKGGGESSGGKGARHRLDAPALYFQNQYAKAFKAKIAAATATAAAKAAAAAAAAAPARLKK